ncbi:FAD-dependent oxidoreductase [Solwaraspora sp. WMMA2080]|uniref:oxidoreductase n=1 Tax=unclassified Solwaraspora TaxID=2627926 RepID=UPI00248B6F7A|nr:MULTISPECIES: FAD-dependent oxidoreductase [unclassified Solwaraspora]WBB99969.1 FAD-dependent oxidoreductase [Solwaraspora sp. WMMA2059]WBC21484.1 FAD-dependent oxidoreductase [Solwaraspora sp. WMMA2080]
MTGGPGGDPLATPLTVGRHRLRNRMVMTPHLGRLPPRRLRRYVAERAAGGVAMIVLPAGQGVYANPVYPLNVCAGDPDGYADPDAVSFHVRDPRHRQVLLAAAHEHLAGLADAAHGGGALAVGQIHHPGAERGWDNFQPTLAPSQVRADDTGAVPHALTVAEIDDLATGYLVTATTIVAAGFDGVELHAGHGYLLNRFLSPHYNRRTDRYGGSPAGRLRLIRRILRTVRAELGDRSLLGVRLTAGEEVPSGIDAAGVAGIAAGLADLVDYVNLSLGNHDGLRDGRPATAYTGSWLVPPAPAAQTARRVRAVIDVPVLVSGRITDPAIARGLVADGAADLVGLARALIADPTFPRRAVSGDDAGIVRCVACNECVRVPFSCPANPAAGREAEFAPRPAAPPAGPALVRRRRARRRIAVVGAGPAGVEAAVGAAAAGAEVTLIEAADVVGGTLRHLVGTPLLADWAPLLHRLERRLAPLLDRPSPAGGRVVLRTATTATADHPDLLGADLVVLATGGRPGPAGFPVDRPVLTTMDLLAGRRPAPGVPVLVVGGAERHLEPLIAADLLAGEGWPVQVCTECVDIGPDLDQRTRPAVLRRLYGRAVVFAPMSRVHRWSGGAVEVEQLFTGQRSILDAGAVVLAHGRTADDGLRAALPADLECQVVGDALAPRRLTHAVLEGARFGYALSAADRR